MLVKKCDPGKVDKCLYRIVTYIIIIPCVTISAVAVVIVYLFAAKFPKVETSKQGSYLRSRTLNATPNLCWVFCALFGSPCN